MISLKALCNNNTKREAKENGFATHPSAVALIEEKFRGWSPHRLPWRKI
jgi:hypothetical protein